MPWPILSEPVLRRFVLFPCEKVTEKLLVGFFPLPWEQKKIEVHRIAYLEMTTEMTNEGRA